MSGEELPPVVATLEGDDSSFLEMLARDVQAAQAFAADLEAALAEGFGGLQISGAEISSEGIGQAGAVIGEELSQGIAEGVGSLDLEPELGRSLGDAASIGAEAGDAITAGLESGIQGATMVGAEISDMLRAGLAQGLPEVDAEVQSVIQQLPSLIDPAATYAGLHIGGALSAAIGTGAGALAATAGLSIVGPLTAASMDAAAQAGGAAGSSLAAAIGDGAGPHLAAAASKVGDSIEAPLADAMAQAGAAGGDALAAGLPVGVGASADTVAQKIAEAVQAPIEASMAGVGASAGDAFNAGFASATGGSGSGGEEGGAAFIDFAGNNEQAAEQQAAELGDKAAVSYSTAWEARYGAIPHGTDIADVLGMQNTQDVFVPNLAEGENAWILASKTGAKDAADAAWQAYGQELTGLVVTPAQFAAMTDGGIEAWKEEVAARAAASGEGFATAFADAITMGMAGIDWSALSDAQAHALGDAMRGTISQGVAQAEPQAAASGAALMEGVVVGAQEALGEVAVIAAEEGDAAGNVFGRFFSGAASGVMAVFARDPELAAATEAAAGDEGASAGSTFGRFFSGAASGALAVFARNPEVAAETEVAAAEEGDAAGSTFGRFFSGAASAALAVFARNPDAAGAAAETGAELGTAMVEGIDESLAAGLQATEMELAATFESIWQHGQLMSSNLAGAMTNALAEIEADTSGFTAEEMAQWDTFFTVLEERGTEAATQLAVTMGSLQGKDLVGQGLSTVGNPMGAGFGEAGQEAEGLASDLGGVEKAAAGATSGFGGMASMMYGPWGMAIYGAMAILPMLSGSLGGLAHLFDPTQATLLNVQNLAQALSTDGNAAGESTAAFVAQSAATDGLSASAARAGVSLATWTEAVVGNGAAQQGVTDSVYMLNQAQINQAQTSKEAASSTGKFSDELKDAASTVPAAELATNNLTAANQQLLNSMHAQNAQIVSQINAQAQLAQATQVLDQQTAIYDASVNALGQAMVTQVTQTQMSNQATAQFGSQVLFAESSVSYMTQAMAASVASSRESALTSAEASVGLLNLGTSQTELNAQLAGAETAYTEAQQGAGAYNTALSALNGTENTLLGSEAAFTGSLVSLTSSIKTNGDSLDANSAKGYANVQAVTAVATAAQAAAVAVYQNEVQTVGANQAYTDAATKLGQEKEAFIQAADKAGANKTAVQQLANELFKLPPNIQVNVGVNTSPAEQGLTDLIRKINSSGATVTVYETSTGTVGTTQTKVQARAGGGPVEAGQLYHVNESGAEGFFTPPANGYIIPHEQFAAIGSGGGAVNGSSASSSGSAPIVVHVYLDGHEISASVRTDAQQYKVRNSQTGF